MILWNRFKCYIKNLKTNSVFNSLFSRFITVFIVSIVFCSVLVINGNAQTVAINQDVLNGTFPYPQYAYIDSSSGAYEESYDVGGYTFENGRLVMSMPFRYSARNVNNYGVKAINVRFPLSVSLSKGQSFTCSFDIDFNISPITNFMPNVVTCFIGNGSNMDGFDWVNNWTSYGDIYNVERSSVETQSVRISSSYYSYFPTSYINEDVSVVVETNFNGSFVVSGTANSDIDDVSLCIYSNPVIRNFGSWCQYTNKCDFTISNFKFYDGNSALINGSLTNIENSLSGKTEETFDNSKIDEYQQKDTEIESMYETALNGTSSYFNDIRGLNDYAFRGVKFFGSCLTELLGITQPFYRLVIISLCLGFFATLLGIGITISSSNKAKADKKGGRGS